MENTASIYQDMAARTGGSVYIGVVGPVRTGKSTFVKRFMETQVLPHIDNMYRRDRAQDELRRYILSICGSTSSRNSCRRRPWRSSWRKAFGSLYGWWTA